MTVDAVCFDLDDTLYDYHQYARAGLREAGAHLEAITGEQYDEELLHLYFEEEITAGTFDVLVERHDLSPALVGDLIEAFHSASTPLDPYDETVPVLERISDSYQLGLLTDGRGGREKLDRLQIAEYFDVVLVTPTMGCSKHQARPFDELISALDIQPERAMYVGDDPRVDFQVPNQRGMTTIRLRRGRYRDLEPSDPDARADNTLTDLTELIPLVE